MGLDVINLVLLALLLLAIVSVLVEVIRKFKSRSEHLAGTVEIANVEPFILHQLKNQIVPYVVSAEQLWRFPAYLLFAIYSYLASVLVAVAGAGILPPVFNQVNDWINSPLSPTSAPASVSKSLTVAGLIIAVSLIAIRTYIGRTNLAKRTFLADSCASELKAVNTRLFMLNNSNGGLNEELTKIGNEVATILQRHIAEKSWPYNPIAPNIESRVDRRTADILRRILRDASVLPNFIQQAPKNTAVEIPNQK